MGMRSGPVKFEINSKREKSISKDQCDQNDH